MAPPGAPAREGEVEAIDGLAGPVAEGLPPGLDQLGDPGLVRRHRLARLGPLVGGEVLDALVDGHHRRALAEEGALGLVEVGDRLDLVDLAPGPGQLRVEQGRQLAQTHELPSPSPKVFSKPSAGSVKENVEPSPSRLSAAMRPPCASTSPRAM